MWSSEIVRAVSIRGAVRRLAAGVGLAVVLAAVGGCQVKPLYGDVGLAADEGVQARLASISVPAGGSQFLQQFVRELEFRLRGGADPAPTRYTLRYITNDRSASLAVPVTLDEPTAISVTLGVDFALIDTATNLTLLTGSSFATASYDYSSQRFANTRASVDAQNRVARSVAQDVGNRLAAYFSANPQS
ncbi:LPS-assembly lipoprotein [Amorphus suaedae]